MIQINNIAPIDLNDKQFILSTNILITDISTLINKAQLRVVREYNFVHVELCWLIGRRINKEILQFKRAQYGDQIINRIGTHLTTQYGRGYSKCQTQSKSDTVFFKYAVEK